MPNNKEKEDEKPVVAKTAVDLQRLKLMKLMKNPEKPVILPERPKAKNTPTVPEFVRNVMGSSAGAGSGEFHVYRHLRRKEYARQKFIQEKGRKELLDDEYHQKLEENKRTAEEITAKKREKRLRKKQKCKGKKRLKRANLEDLNKHEDNSTEEECSDHDEINEDNGPITNKLNENDEDTKSLNLGTNENEENKDSCTNESELGNNAGTTDDSSKKTLDNEPQSNTSTGSKSTTETVKNEDSNTENLKTSSEMCDKSQNNKNQTRSVD